MLDLLNPLSEARDLVGFITAEPQEELPPFLNIGCCNITATHQASGLLLLLAVATLKLGMTL